MYLAHPHLTSGRTVLQHVYAPPWKLRLSYMHAIGMQQVATSAPLNLEQKLDGISKLEFALLEWLRLTLACGAEARAPDTRAPGSKNRPPSEPSTRVTDGSSVVGATPSHSL